VSQNICGPLGQENNKALDDYIQLQDITDITCPVSAEAERRQHFGSPAEVAAMASIFCHYPGVKTALQNMVA